ncbi:Flp family type IVb pilin [Sphaerimonospora mesophila]|uniref:Flp family type IVb pilin n=1 Tax=Sphaerimonospora mesophila TaxID=37483 RepID=UPI0006E230F3
MRLPGNHLPPQIDCLLMQVKVLGHRLREERGASTLEWVVLTALIIGIAIGAVAVLKSKVDEWLGKIP